jgi:hypothetical protein
MSTCPEAVAILGEIPKGWLVFYQAIYSSEDFLSIGFVKKA